MVAGISISIPLVKTTAGIGQSVASIVPHYGSNTKNIFKTLNNQKEKKFFKNWKDNNKHVISGELITLGKFNFNIINDNGRISFQPLFVVKDNVHIYQHKYKKNEICIAQLHVRLTLEQSIQQLEFWVQGYKCYLNFGFWDHAEVKNHEINKIIGAQNE